MNFISGLLTALLLPIVTADNPVAACPGPVVTGKGFNVDYYNYPLEGQAGFNPDGSINVDFYKNGYKYQGGKFGTVTGVTDIQFYERYPTTKIWAVGKVYGETTLISDFTLVYTGFFKAPMTGNYTFYLAADDDISLQLGRGAQCCGDFDDIVSDQIEIGTYGESFDEGTTHSAPTLRTTNYTVSFTKGLFYPIRMVYFNSVGSHVLQASIVRPDGSKTSSFADVYQLDTSVNCPSMTTQAWTGTQTTDQTITSIGQSTVTEIIVKTPLASGNVSTTIAWNGTTTATTTVTALYTTTIAETTKTAVVTSIIVQTPSSNVTSLEPTIVKTFSFHDNGTRPSTTTDHTTTVTTTETYTAVSGSLTETGTVTLTIVDPTTISSTSWETGTASSTGFATSQSAYVSGHHGSSSHQRPGFSSTIDATSDARAADPQKSAVGSSSVASLALRSATSLTNRHNATGKATAVFQSTDSSHVVGRSSEIAGISPIASTARNALSLVASDDAKSGKLTDAATRTRTIWDFASTTLTRASTVSGLSVTTTTASTQKTAENVGSGMNSAIGGVTAPTSIGFPVHPELSTSTTGLVGSSEARVSRGGSYPSFAGETRSNAKAGETLSVSMAMPSTVPASHVKTPMTKWSDNSVASLNTGVTTLQASASTGTPSARISTQSTLNGYRPGQGSVPSNAEQNTRMSTLEGTDSVVASAKSQVVGSRMLTSDNTANSGSAYWKVSAETKPDILSVSKSTTTYPDWSRPTWVTDGNGGSLSTTSRRPLRHSSRPLVPAHANETDSGNDLNPKTTTQESQKTSLSTLPVATAGGSKVTIPADGPSSSGDLNAAEQSDSRDPSKTTATPGAKPSKWPTALTLEASSVGAAVETPKSGAGASPASEITQGPGRATNVAMSSQSGENASGSEVDSDKHSPTPHDNDNTQTPSGISTATAGINTSGVDSSGAVPGKVSYGTPKNGRGRTSVNNNELKPVAATSSVMEDSSARVSGAPRTEGPRNGMSANSVESARSNQAESKSGSNAFGTASDQTRPGPTPASPSDIDGSPISGGASSTSRGMSSSSSVSNGDGLSGEAEGPQSGEAAGRTTGESNGGVGDASGGDSSSEAAPSFATSLAHGTSPGEVSAIAGSSATAGFSNGQESSEAGSTEASTNLMTSSLSEAAISGGGTSGISGGIGAGNSITTTRSGAAAVAATAEAATLRTTSASVPTLRSSRGSFSQDAQSVNAASRHSFAAGAALLVFLTLVF